jgi:branched-subunit amino acid ABC-type transport system permease component
MNAGTLITSLVDGLLIGVVYGIAAMGLNLIWGVMRVINLAHGAIIALGMFGVYLFFSSLGLNPYVALALVAVLGLLRGTGWGSRAAALMNTFLVNIVSIVLFTGPLKEFLFQGSVTGPTWKMTAILVLAAIPPVYFLIRLAKTGAQPAARGNSESVS